MSYQLTVLISVPSITFVNGASKIEEWGFPIISVETTGRVEYSTTLFILSSFAALFTVLLISSIVTLFSHLKKLSTTELSGTGTRMAIPSSFPFNSGRTFPTARAAPVVVGIIFTAAALLLLQSE